MLVTILAACGAHAKGATAISPAVSQGRQLRREVYEFSLERLAKALPEEAVPEPLREYVVQYWDPPARGDVLARFSLSD